MSEASYYDKVYEVTKSIPLGRVSTYGHIANYLSLGSARMVGWALTQSNKNGMSQVPAHRVVNRKGELSGRIHFATPTLMQDLLENEGIAIQDNVVQDFKNIVWDPANS